LVRFSQSSKFARKTVFFMETLKPWRAGPDLTNYVLSPFLYLQPFYINCHFSKKEHILIVLEVISYGFRLTFDEMPRNYLWLLTCKSYFVQHMRFGGFCRPHCPSASHILWQKLFSLLLQSAIERLQLTANANKKCRQDHTVEIC